MRDRSVLTPGLPTRNDLFWVSLSLSVGLLVAFVYLITHPYPAYGAGLYLEISEQILAHGYGFPETISHYTSRGVPFAYPPLMFYVNAFILDSVPVDPIALSRYLPVLLTVLYLIPYYFLARELLEEAAAAGLATIILAMASPTLQWHLSAGGLVRAMAFLLVLTGSYTGLRLFRSGNRQWLIPSTLLFGATVLTHPIYTVFFGLTYVLFYLAFDHSLGGLVSGSIVAVGGIVLVSPWWYSVARRHGVDVFFAAAGTHSGLFGGLDRLFDQFVYPLVTGYPTSIFFLLSFAGTFYFLGRQRLLLPTWLVTGAFVLGKARFQFVAGSMMAGSFLVAVARNTLRDPSARAWKPTLHRALAVVFVFVIVVSLVSSAATLTSTDPTNRWQPQFIDRSDETAMTWVSQNTAQSADFVVLGDAAEWFPLLADRTILIGPWGIEWEGPTRYNSQLSQYRTLSTCSSEQCITRGLRDADVRPNYLYVPKESYTVRGESQNGTVPLRQTLNRSNRYQVAYENQGVTIYRVNLTARRDEPAPDSLTGTLPR
ncbi:hypothetical protein [Halobellus captivus]|uniref:hypothetical protein n=1 Tax=Halobellus captivus TaxID=2592614 RepID=UPI0011A6A9BD|nr:hypothetical protein [Halobellus captivus]